MLIQGYNIQTAVAEGQIILAATATGVSSDGGQLAPTVADASANLARAGITDAIEEVLADSGYWQIRQVTALHDQGVRVLIPPPQKNAHSRDRMHPAAREMHELLTSEDAQASYRRRQQIIEPVFGHWKHIRGITRLLRRGAGAVQAEIDLIATTHNLLKIYRHTHPAG